MKIKIYRNIIHTYHNICFLWLYSLFCIYSSLLSLHERIPASNSPQFVDHCRVRTLKKHGEGAILLASWIGLLSTNIKVKSLLASPTVALFPCYRIELISFRTDTLVTARCVQTIKVTTAQQTTTTFIYICIKHIGEIASLLYYQRRIMIKW